MTQGQFTRLFTYMEQRFDRVDERFEAVDNRFDRLTNLIDGYAGKLDTYGQEMAFGDHRINRLEKYVQVIAKKVGVDLDKINI